MPHEKKDPKCAHPDCNRVAEHYTEVEDESFVEFRAFHCTEHWQAVWCALLGFGFVSDLGGAPTDYLGNRVRG